MHDSKVICLMGHTNVNHSLSLSLARSLDLSLSPHGMSDQMSLKQKLLSELDVRYVEHRSDKNCTPLGQQWLRFTICEVLECYRRCRCLRRVCRLQNRRQLRLEAAVDRRSLGLAAKGRHERSLRTGSVQSDFASASDTPRIPPNHVHSFAMLIYKYIPVWHLMCMVLEVFGLNLTWFDLFRLYLMYDALYTLPSTVPRKISHVAQQRERSAL
jgi:hypothetical protein